MGNVFGSCDGADEVCVFDGEVGDRRDRTFQISRTALGRGIPDPVRQDEVAASVGMKNGFEGKSLFGAEARMLPDELERPDLAAIEQAKDLPHVVVNMLTECG